MPPPIWTPPVRLPLRSVALNTPDAAPAVAFGRHLSPAAASKEGGDALKFTFEKPGGTDARISLPYWQQGNESFDKTQNARLRACLLGDGRVQHELGRFWAVYCKEDGEHVSKHEYARHVSQPAPR